MPWDQTQSYQLPCKELQTRTPPPPSPKSTGFLVQTLDLLHVHCFFKTYPPCDNSSIMLRWCETLQNSIFGKFSKFLLWVRKANVLSPHLPKLVILTHFVVSYKQDRIFRARELNSGPNERVHKYVCNPLRLRNHAE